MTPREAFALAAHVAAKGKTLPILECIKISGGRVMSTDMVQQIDVPVELPATLAKAEFCVHAARLMKVLKALPEDLELELKQSKAQLHVAAGPTRYKLNTLPTADFPTIEESATDSTTLDVPSKDLIAALRFVSGAMAVADIRYYLNGALVDIEGKRIVITATNGHVVHRTRIAIDGHEGDAIGGIIGNTSVARVLEVAGRHETVSLSLSATQFGIEDAEVLITKLVDGKHPDTDRVIPASRPATAGIARLAFLAAVKRMAAIAPPGITLAFAQEAITLSASNAAGEEASEAFEWNASAVKVKPMEQGFNLDYLTTALEAFTCERINVHLGEASDTSLYFTDDGDGSQQIVIMPMRV